MDGEAIGVRHGVVVPVPTDPTGRRGPTRRQAAGPDWRRTSRGLYVPAHVERGPAQRVVEAGIRSGSSRLVVTGWGSLCWQGSRWSRGLTADGSLRPVDLSGTNRDLRPSPEHVLHQERLRDRDVVLVDGLLVTSPAAAVCLAVRTAPSRVAAVEVLDMAYADDLVSPDEVAAWVDACRGHHGLGRVREALARSDENVWSPQEVAMRLVWEDVTGRRPLTNRPLFDLSGRHLGTPDLFDPVSGIGGEYDGDHHLDRAQRRRDLARDQELRAHGVETFVVVAGDLDPARFAARLLLAQQRAARIPATDRRWTLEQPTWWRSTLTVDQRRALPPHLRETWHPAHTGRRRPA